MHPCSDPNYSHATRQGDIFTIQPFNSHLWSTDRVGLHFFVCVCICMCTYIFSTWDRFIVITWPHEIMCLGECLTNALRLILAWACGSQIISHVQPYKVKALVEKDSKKKSQQICPFNRLVVWVHKDLRCFSLGHHDTRSMSAPLCHVIVT